MEGFHSNSKMAKLLKGNLENVDLNSPLFRYLCAQSQCQSPMDALKQRRRHLSPLSPVENLMERSPPSIVYRTPVRGVQREEVLVMDGVLVTGGGRSARSASDLLSSSSSSDSSGKILYKTDLCRSWEDSGSCRYTSKGQIAPGKEKPRPTRFPVKNKSEALMCKSYTGTGLCTPSPKSHFVHPVMAISVTEAASATTQAASSTAPKATMKTPTTTISFLDWSPQDDGIEVVLPYSSTGTPPSREDISSYITDVLYGPTTRRILPVFAEIFPE
ncbi:unnamed protein product [Prunus armeniaca]